MSGIVHCGSPFCTAEHIWQDGNNPDEVFRCPGGQEEPEEDDEYERADDE